MPGRIILFSLLVLFTACKPSEEKLMDNIQKAETALFGDNQNFKFDDALAREAVKAYGDFVKHYPKHEKAPEILLKSADLHRALKEHAVALELYQTIERDYQDFPKLPHVIFLQGFVYENEMAQLDKAKERYETFLSKYPDHELSEDVRFSLKNLGKTPEEIIREFEMNMQAEEGI